MRNVKARSTPPSPPDIKPPTEPPTVWKPGDSCKRIDAFVKVVFDENDPRKFLVQQKNGRLRHLGVGTLKELRSKANQFQGKDIVVDVRNGGRWVRCENNPFLGLTAVKEELVSA